MSEGNSPTSDRPDFHRLPYGVQPRRYDLRLAPDLTSATFSGDVVVKADVTGPVSQIVLNSLDLEVSSAVVTAGDGRLLPCEVRLDKSSERVVLSLPEAVRPGPIEIAMSFSGVLNEDLRGFYRSTFTDSSGELRTIASTQFEATDARRAFPCFDEPDRKAVFEVTVDAPDGLAAFSNSPVVERTPLEGGVVRHRFAPTISMSSYLVAIVVGPLEATEPVDVDGTAVRVVHVPGKGDLCRYALDVAAHALRFFTDWFGIPYPGEKLDLVAIPDFAFGAMENLGCVTFREVLLLIDPDRASRLELERVADVISHEIAHMWFGDLVTMKWWNGIWLNEAFATFMELLCVDNFHPQWMRWTSFGMERSAAMAVDALHSTRPVEYPVGPPEEAEGMFDVLTYQKGAGVLRMLEQYLGPARFRDGVRTYLNAHLLSNTDTSDLWDSIERATGEPVREIMDSWIFQGGFPLVSVATRPEGVELTQQPFSYARADGPSAIGSSWKVPVITRVVGAADGNGSRRLLGPGPTTLELPRADDGASPVLVNAGGSGYYRVHYEPEDLRRLSRVMASLDPLERSNVLDDVWASVLSGHCALTDFLLVAEALESGSATEDDPDVWSRLTSVLSLLDHAVDDHTRLQLAAYTRAIARPAFDRLGFAPRETDDERTLGLRAQLLSVLGTVGQDPEVREECARMQADELAGRGELDPNLASAVAGVVACSGSEVEFDEFLERYRHPATPQDEARYRSALTGFPQPELAARAFDVALKEVRAQDTPYFVQLLLTSRENGPATWARVRDRWEELVGRVPSQTVPRMLDGVRLICRDPAVAREIRSFIAAHPLRTGQRSVDQTLERQDVLVALATRLEEDADTALADGCERIAGRIAVSQGTTRGTD